MEKSSRAPVNTQELALKLFNMIKPSGWHNMLKGFILSDDFYHILATLDKNVNEGKRFTPVLSNLFKAFIKCPLEDLKCVIVAEEPCTTINIANGCAFSSSNAERKDPNAVEIFKALDATIYGNTRTVQSQDGNLTRWSQQGVLLLNLSLTAEIDKSNRHFALWDPFIKYLIDMLNVHPEKLTWVFMGERARETEDLVNDKHDKLFCSHPSSALFSESKIWQSNDIFNKVNESLLTNNKQPIEW